MVVTFVPESSVQINSAYYCLSERIMQPRHQSHSRLCAKALSNIARTCQPSRSLIMATYWRAGVSCSALGVTMPP